MIKMKEAGPQYFYIPQFLAAPDQKGTTPLSPLNSPTPHFIDFLPCHPPESRQSAAAAAHNSGPHRHHHTAALLPRSGKLPDLGKLGVRSISSSTTTTRSIEGRRGRLVGKGVQRGAIRVSPNHFRSWFRCFGLGSSCKGDPYEIEEGIDFSFCCHGADAGSDNARGYPVDHADPVGATAVMSCRDCALHHPRLVTKGKVYTAGVTHR
ncbi:uncharacterized protein BCR38DRAFT_429904 [Pseudomassariella vexata]|uniref:Uncharacterized protein n=1 Tax=Pseudomassariella vexata TaxID=1141098 RepID=A0A1Y2E4G2_9PEZI|nr:uncharacterized protein BCR38DRAFT_429904 [Pseudomassariella vexata]ORY66327.1 hypothetical protein BCR38DRAFT_429904 [Pseudomassariella vexata]